MKHFRHTLRSALVAALGALTFGCASTSSTGPGAVEASASQISSASHAALLSLYASNPKARAIGRHARAVLVFPSIAKGGFVVAAQYGEGAMFSAGGVSGYYSTAAASYGLQAGLQQFGYAMFFMNDKAMEHLHDSGGFALGSAPSLVVVDKGISGSLSTDNLTKGIYAFFFNQQGLMGGLGLQGSKITEIHPN